MSHQEDGAVMPEHALLKNDNTSDWLGIEVHLAQPGHAVISMVVRDEMLNGFGITHGGMIFAFADTCFAMTCNDPAGSEDTITVAQGVDINFISSPRAGAKLTAEGKLLATTGRSGLCDITVTDDQDNLVAHFRGRSRTIPARKKGAQA